MYLITNNNGDLSRRKSSYRLAGLSFREYLVMNGIINYQSLTLNDLIANHQDISNELTGKIKIIPHFKEYLKTGYFPFYNEDPSSYFDRLNSILNVIIETDIPAVSEITFQTSLKLKKLLAVISSTAPYVPNLLNLRRELFVSDQRTLLKYLDFLEKAEVINTLSQKARGNKILHKPDKIYLANTNYFYGLNMSGEEPGTIRETFFISQVSIGHELKLPSTGYFTVNGNYVFEIGGKNKSNQQIKDLKNAWLVLDDI